MSQRVVTAILLLPILIASIWIEKLLLVFLVFACAAMGFGLMEFWSLAQKCDLEPDRLTGSIFAGLIFAAFVFDRPQLLPALVSALVCIALVRALLRGAPFDRMIGRVGATLLGVLYVALLGGFLVGVRRGFEPLLGAKLLSFFLLVIMGADTAAYYAGRAFGKHKLAPAISPGKTWEGAVAGMIASLAAAVIAHHWFFAELRPGVGLVLAAVMNVVGVVGDLTESALKRGAGAKDAASILPGHGGFLDRLDSLLFNAPLLYFFGKAYFGA